jgi:hypothetical protein
MVMPPIDLTRFDCTDPGKGPWKVVPNLPKRSVDIRHARNGFVHHVFYGTRTERTEEQAEVQATALCALLNHFKAKRP